MRPDILFIGNDMDRVEIEAVLSHIARLGMTGALAHPNRLTVYMHAGKTRLFLDGDEIQPKVIVGWVFEEVLIPGMYLLKVLEKAGFTIINSADTLFNGQNKFIGTQMLNRARVPHFPVLCGSYTGRISALAELIDFPVVSKPLVGVGGRSVVRIEDKRGLEAVSEILDGHSEYTYVQPYIEKDSEQDIRVVCIDYRPIYAYSRTAKSGNWITNLLAGGRGDVIPIEPDVGLIASQAAKACNSRISGVDVVRLKHTKELRIFEVNTCPAMKISKYIPSADDTVEREVASFLIQIAQKQNKLAEVG